VTVGWRRGGSVYFIFYIFFFYVLYDLYTSSISVIVMVFITMTEYYLNVVKVILLSLLKDLNNYLKDFIL